MHKLSGNVIELGEPEANVVAITVVVLALLHNVESVHAAARHASTRAPVAPVAVGIVVQQLCLEIVGSVPPIGVGVKGKEGTNVLPTAVGLEAGGCELAHIGIDERITSPPLLPRGDCTPVEAPAPRVGVGTACVLPKNPIEGEDAAAVLLGKELEEIAPKQLEHNPVGGFVGDSERLVAATLPRNVARGEAPVGEPGRKLRGVVGADHAVAGVEVYFEAVLVPNVVLDADESCSLAASEGHDTPGIVGLGIPRLFRGIPEILQGWKVGEGAARNRFAPDDFENGLLLDQREFGGGGGGERLANLQLLLHLVPEGRKGIRHTVDSIVEGKLLRIVQGGSPDRFERSELRSVGPGDLPDRLLHHYLL